MTLLWIPLTIIAAFLQNVRSMLQKQLKDQLGTVGAAFAEIVSPKKIMPKIAA